MLQKSSNLKGYQLRAHDGDIGEVVDFLFSDHDWTIRYLVVETGPWLERRPILISPISLGTPNDPDRVLRVDLDREQIEKSPALDSRKPLSRHYEAEYHQYYSWPYYWVGGGLWGAYGYPTELMRHVQSWKDEQEGGEPENPHLRSIHEVAGYHLEARDGEIGHIRDFFIEDETWSIIYLEIDTRNWWPGGKKVLLARQWVEEVSWKERKVKADITREAIQSAPPYDEKAPVSDAYELSLFQHYGREYQPRS